MHSAALVSPGTTDTLIGTDIDNGVGTAYNAYTDIEFDYTPENDFTGKLTGAKLRILLVLKLFTLLQEN